MRVVYKFDELKFNIQILISRFKSGLGGELERQKEMFMTSEKYHISAKERKISMSLP